MFLKIDNQLFNIENFQYFEYIDDELNLRFNGNVGTVIKQNEAEHKEFLSFINGIENIVITSNIGINLKNISGVTNDNNNLTIYFIDGSFKKYDSKILEEFENQIAGA